MLSISERRIIVRLHNQGKTQEFISNVVGCSQQTVSVWIRNFKTRDNLENLPKSGRPTKLTKDTLKKLKTKLKKLIEKKNDDFGSITTKELRIIIKEEVGILYSIRHVERIMHKLGFSLIMPRTMHTRHDQNAVDNFRDEYKKNFKKPIWIMK